MFKALADDPVLGTNYIKWIEIPSLSLLKRCFQCSFPMLSWSTHVCSFPLQESTSLIGFITHQRKPPGPCWPHSSALLLSYIPFGYFHCLLWFLSSFLPSKILTSYWLTDFFIHNPFCYPDFQKSHPRFNN